VTEIAYVGRELDVFQHAKRWKRYLRAQIGPHLDWHVGAEVLEVGAGIGATALMLCPPSCKRWVCLEPDSGLLATLRARIEAGELPACCGARQGTTADLAGERFDAVLYVDVMEHIEDDAGEAERAAGLLRAGGKLVVLAPAHQWLYSPFDRAIGHYRRYSKATLRGIGPRGMRLTRLRYLDVAGLASSLGNRLLLKQSMPTLGQVRLWDGVLVPVSRVVDPLIGYMAGKSVLGVWEKV
jgi:SAM-dependent methyltransferase